MRIHLPTVFLFLVLACCAAPAGVSYAATPELKRTLVFRGISYFYRWSKNDETEFTPEKQEDLNKWTDMITVNDYPEAGDGERLAATANAVLDNYKTHAGTVLKTRSIPRAADRPAEHLIAVKFLRADFIEIAFARFTLVNGKGRSLVYSHRIYGSKIEDQMNAWLSGNGDEVEKALLEWTAGGPLII